MSSARNTRAKGTAFEREVAQTFEQAGFQVRGLESGGDHFAVALDGTTIHLECKRQERLKLSEWLRQQDGDCPAGMRRGLVFRQSRQPAYVVEPLSQFVARERLLGDLTAFRTECPKCGGATLIRGTR